MIDHNGISKTKVLLILLVILVFLLGLFAGSRIFYHEDIYPSISSTTTTASHTLESLSGEDIDPAAVYLVNLSEEQVQKVQLINEAGQMLFAANPDKVDGEKPKHAAETVYYLEEPKWDIINQAEVQTLVQSLFTIRYKRAVTENEKNGDLGFDKPTVRVIYSLADGREAELLLGKTLDNGEVCARMTGDDKVYLVSGIAERLQRGPLSLLSDNITTIDNRSIKHFIFKRRSDHSELAFSILSKLPQPTLSPSISPTGMPQPSPTVAPNPMNLLDRKWELVAPLHWDAKSGDINSMVSELSTIYPQEYVAYGDVDLTKYGLDKPAYTISLQSDYEEAVLEIGSMTGPGRRFARITQYPIVFVLNMSQFSLLDQTLLGLTSPYFASLNINSILEVDITTPDEQIYAQVMVPTKEEQEKDPELHERFYVNGMDANITSFSQDHYFKQFYRSLIALQIDGVDKEAPADYAAEFKIMYTLKSEMTDMPNKAQIQKDGSPRIVLEFAERDQQTYHVYLNGQASGFYMNKSQFQTNRNGLDGFTKTWARLSEAIFNQVDGKYATPTPEQ